MTNLITELIRKKRRKKLPQAISVLKIRGRGMARYDHDHRFNGFVFTPSLA